MNATNRLTSTAVTILALAYAAAIVHSQEAPSSAPSAATAPDSSLGLESQLKRGAEAIRGLQQPDATLVAGHRATTQPEAAVLNESGSGGSRGGSTETQSTPNGMAILRGLLTEAYRERFNPFLPHDKPPHPHIRGAPAKIVYLVEQSRWPSDRFGAIQQELRESLNNRSKRDEFQVIFFSGNAISELRIGDRAGLYEASPDHIEAAQRWVQEQPLKSGNKVSPEAGLRAAFRLQPDHICLLPAGELPDSTPQIVHDLNKDGKVQVHTIAVARRDGEAVLLKIAEQNDGTYRFIAEEFLALPGTESPTTQPATAPTATQSAEPAAASGLMCELSLATQALRIGDEFQIEAKIRNVSDKPLAIYMPPDYRAGLLEMRDGKGDPVDHQPTAITEGWMMNKPFVVIQPGEAFPLAFAGRLAMQIPWPGQNKPATLAAVFGQDATDFRLGAPGKFSVSLKLSADEKTARPFAKTAGAAAWIGQVVSNEVRFEVRAATREELDQAIGVLNGRLGEKTRRAIRLLAAHADAKAVPALVRLLVDEPDVRADASAALAAIKDPTVVAELTAEYRKAASVEHREALLAVIQSASDIAQISSLYLDIAQSKLTWDERARAISHLVDFRRPEVLPILLPLLGSGSPIEKRFAIDVMGPFVEWPDKWPQAAANAAVDAVLNVLKNDADGQMRGRAAGSLRFGKGRIVPALVEAIKDDGARFYAADAIKRFAGPEAIPLLEQLLAANPDEGTRAAAEAALKAVRERAEASRKPTSRPATQPAAP